MADTERLPLPLESAEILKRSHTAFRHAVKQKFGCETVFHNVELTSAPSFGNNKGGIVPEMKYSKQFTKNLKISVWKDDLTTHKVDAVVNAANEQLSHGGGLALALSRAGGPQIQQQSDEITKVQGHIPTGKAVLTPAGKLPCKAIIHAVGPYVPPHASKSEIANASSLLEKAIWSIIQHTEYNNLQSVAIPAISSGLYNFPVELCADVIVKTLRSYIDRRHPQSTSLEIRLVNNDDPSVREMLRACNKFLGPANSQSGAMQIPSTSSFKAVGPHLELGDVTLHLKKGPIQDETADAIVNTISDDLNLTKGFVSKAILEKAGHKIQEEIKRNFHGYGLAPDGHVVQTGGYKLKCSAVYHTVVTSSSQKLHDVVAECLKRAGTRQFSSISFPAIGTGHLGFGKEEVARTMIGAVKEFARKYKGQKMDVNFVIFPKDVQNYEAFEKEMDSIKRTQGPQGQSFSSHESDEVGGTPCIMLYGNSCEAVREAKAWAVGILQKATEQFKIYNNNIIHFGQKDHDKLMFLQSVFNVNITESIRDGKCGITIIGEPTDVSSAALEVEDMLCQAQESYAQAEENDLLHSVVCWQAFPGSETPENNAALEKAYLADAESKVFSVNGQNIKIDFRNMRMQSENGGARVERICLYSLYSKLKSGSYYARTPVDKITGPTEKVIKSCGLFIVKMEKIENHALEQVFGLNRKRLQCTHEKLYQCVKAQYCELICRVGFQREYAPPEEQKYGDGIYFTKKVEDALKLWKDSEEEYVYIVVAQVLTGKSTVGSPEMIVPPPIRADTPLVRYNSVTDRKSDICVIFNGQQALPEYIVTCCRTSRV